MADETDSSNWILVDKNDCIEEPLAQPRPVSTPDDSDQESDSSISIISFCHSDTSLEGLRVLASQNGNPVEGINFTDTGPEIKNPVVPVALENVVQSDEIFTCGNTAAALNKQIDDNSTCVSTPTVSQEKSDENVTDSSVCCPEVLTEIENGIKSSIVNDADVEFNSTVSLSSNETEHNPFQPIALENKTQCDEIPSDSTANSNCQWTFVDSSKTESETKQFYLDCSQEPVLEISDADTEPNSSMQEIQTLATQNNSDISNRSVENITPDSQFNFIPSGILISVVFLTLSVFIKYYLDSDDMNILTNNIFDISETNLDIRNLCNQAYSDENEVEQCISMFQTKTKKDTFALYLKLKELVLDLKEKKLAEKEKEIFKKSRRRAYIGELGQRENKGKHKGKKEEKQLNSKMNKKTKNEIDIDKVTFQSYLPRHSKEHNMWIAPDKKYNKPTKSKDKSLVEKVIKNFKKQFRSMEKGKKLVNKNLLNNIAEKVKKIVNKEKSKGKGDPNAELYIKYNPLKNTVELLNITSLSHEDHDVFYNGNGSINGEWYFNLYGLSRSSIRHKENLSEWYFKRGQSREIRRDKAKWYFDYMAHRRHRWIY